MTRTGRERARRKLALAGGLAALLAAFAVLLGVPGGDTARADFGDGVQISDFRTFPTSTQAGGHADVVVEFGLEARLQPQLDHPCQCNEAKEIVVDMPAGVIGNPHAYPKCQAADFAFFSCPIDSQVGVARPVGCIGFFCLPLATPIYNLVPIPGQAALVGFMVPIFDAPIYQEVTARTGGDYGLRITVANIQRFALNTAFQQTLWGVPSDPKNDGPLGTSTESDALIADDGSLVGRFFPGRIALGTKVGAKSNWPLVPFMQNPTTCGQPMQSSIRVLAYDGGVTQATTTWPAGTGCGQLSFNPTLAASPTTTEADSPSGIDVVLTVPQLQSPTVPSPSSIRNTKVVMPPGFSINTNAADGKSSCSDAQARFGTQDQARCPEFAKVGTLEIHSATLPGVLPGAVYLGEPLPGNRYRLFLVADGFGLHVKLPGTVSADPQTGQLTVSFEDLPETPIERFNMHFFGAERGVLATPTRCGRYPVVSSFTPWNNALPEQSATQFFEITSGPGGTPCPPTPRPFAPAFTAASQGNTAGVHTPFTVDLARADGDQFLTGLSVATPEGFSGKLAGVPYCPEPAIATISNPLYPGIAELSSPLCAASQIGTVVAGAGAGSRPLYQPGKAYLAGPYKGAPLSLVVVIPAVSGPYDLGNIAVRVAIHVNPVTARVSTVSDPLPQIIEGIPLRTRSIRVNIDRPNFALNPTDCSPLSSDAQITGAEGGLLNASAHYQVANCAILPFEPKLSLRFRGKTKRTGHMAVRSVLRAAPGEANIGRVAVTLPDSQLLDNSRIQNPCTRVQFAANACPASSRVGFAAAKSPLLDEPLRGPVYLRSSNNKLPDLVVDLKGQIDIELAGRIDSVKDRLRTTFQSVPDVPVSKFVLNLRGGKQGLLFNNRNICKSDNVALLRIKGQNGKSANRKAKVSTPCGKRKRAKRSSHQRSNDNRLFRARKAG